MNRKDLRVLVIDDEPAAAELVRVHLEREGYTVTTTNDSRSAIALAGQLRPHVIVTDLMMPEVSGVDICRAIRGDPEMAGTFIVMVSARREIEDRIAALDIGVDEYLTKPFPSRELVARLRAALRIITNEMALRDKNRELMRASEEVAEQRDRLAEALVELAEAQEKLLDVERRKARAETISQMAVTLGHEINNPLMGVLGFTQELCGRAAPDTEERRMFDLVLGGLDRIKEIVARIQRLPSDPKVVPYYGDLKMFDVRSEETPPSAPAE